MDYKDYYKILGLAKGASEKEIKAAYRRLARKFHPDMNPGDAKAETRFKEINEAHEVLSDKEKRRRYDQLGANWNAVSGAWASGRPAGGRVRVDVENFGGGGFSDFFETFFGRKGEAGPDLEDLLRGARGAGRGGDIEYEAELTLEEVLRGTTRTLKLVGGRAGRQVEVKIPAGVRDGARLRVAREGAPGAAGGPPGDLYLRVRVLPHRSFVRSGDDLQIAVTVPLTTAVLGGEASVPTLEGQVGIKVPAGTPVGRVFRLRGQGLPRSEDGERGDLLAQVAVALPEHLNQRERELFEELRRLGR